MELKHEVRLRSSHFDQLLQINRESFDEGHYNTAYHALASALYCAQDEHDLQKALLVGETAQTQAQWIDKHVREYEHSSYSAIKRGIHTGGIYTMLSRQAMAVAEIIKPYCET